VRILIVSGYPQDDKVQNLLGGSEIGFITKPYKLDSLGNAVAAGLQATQ